VGPTVSDYGRKREEVGPAKWIELITGPAERNVPERIKCGSRVTASLTKK
jgi:hypothetical protein